MLKCITTAKSLFPERVSDLDTLLPSTSRIQKLHLLRFHGNIYEGTGRISSHVLSGVLYLKTMLFQSGDDKLLFRIKLAFLMETMSPIFSQCNWPWYLACWTPALPLRRIKKIPGKQGTEKFGETSRGRQLTPTYRYCWWSAQWRFLGMVPRTQNRRFHKITMWIPSDTGIEK